MRHVYILTTYNDEWEGDFKGQDWSDQCLTAPPVFKSRKAAEAEAQGEANNAFGYAVCGDLRWDVCEVSKGKHVAWEAAPVNGRGFYTLSFRITRQCVNA